MEFFTELFVSLGAVLMGLVLLFLVAPIALMFWLIGRKMRLAEQMSKRQMLYMQQVFRPDLNNQQVFRPGVNHPQTFYPDPDPRNQMQDQDDRYR